MPEEQVTAEAFLSRLMPRLYDPVDEDGDPLPAMGGLKLKPITSKESIEIETLMQERGRELGYAFTAVRAIVRPDGTRILSDDDAAKLDQVIGPPIKRILTVVRSISQMKDEPEKKTPLKTIPDLNTSSDSPKTSDAPSPAS